MMAYQTVIGLEVHAELATESKIFCGCTTAFGAEPNTHCCPLCIGMPGVLPVLNEKAVAYTVKAGLALHCEISSFSKMDRKNYFYPDLPKAYQISQYDLPLCKDGYLDIEVDGQQKRVRILRIHLEEDAGKLLHDAHTDGTLVDYNRGGVPLMEIVTHPDMHSPEEAVAFMEKLRSILLYIGVSDCKMEEGSLRCDLNLSVRPEGGPLGIRTEMKNLNSFKMAFKAAQYEAKRQIKLLEKGESVTQETRRWDDAAGKSLGMRSKEEAHDYRYFPEPDLVPIEMSPERVEELRASLPELPEAKKKRYMDAYHLPAYDAEILTGSYTLAQYFESVIDLYPQPKEVSNWLMGDVLRLMKDQESDEIPVPPETLAALCRRVEEGVINRSAGKTVLEALFGEGGEVDALIEKLGLKQVSDAGELEAIVEKVLSENPQSVTDFKAGKGKALGHLMGQVMRATQGKANPQMVNELLKKKLGG
jgi:aspartyl-tRNA(Asn)/glutamyl-tRNA(Gln) amidotransferase subunit B